MKRKRFTEEPIIAVLQEREAGAKTGDLTCKHGISEAPLYNWKAKYGGMDVSDAKHLKAFEDENAKLKKLLADQMEAAARKELLSKNGRARCEARSRRTSAGGHGPVQPARDGDWDYVFDAASVELMAMGKLVTTANQGPDVARWTENHSVISIT